MVSRVYTPLLPSYSRKQNITGGMASAVPSTLEEARQSVQEEPTSADNNSNRPSTGLQSIQFDSQKQIPLTAVIHDFKNTMNALGADDPTRSEVTAYLNVVRLQAAKTQPEVSFMKQTLRTAANSLDQYIGKALGQPSTVVKEWVDALLLQNIDYHADIPADSIADETSTPTESNPTHPEEHSSNAKANASIPNSLSPPGLDTFNKARLKQLIESAKAQQQSGQHPQADNSLNQALELVQTQNRPEWEGKIWHLRGRFLEESGQWQEATHALQQAADCFQTANLPDKQTNVLHTLASIWDEHGRLDEAIPIYQQVVAHDEQQGTPQALIHSLNDLGSAYLRQGQASDATITLEKAAQLAQQTTTPAAMQGDILSNLGVAYRQTQQSSQAIATYQQALQTARLNNDRPRYGQALQQLAGLFVDTNQPEQAMKALVRLQKLRQTPTSDTSA